MKTLSNQTKPKAEPAAPAEDPLFTELWERFRNEAGFVPEAMEQEKQRVRDDIAALEARVADKREALEAIDRRENAARDQLIALFAAKLSTEAILTAMRVEYKVKKVSAPRALKTADSASDAVVSDDKDLVLSHLDAEGLSLKELKDITGRDGQFLQAVLKTLVEEDKVSKTGDGKAARFHLVTD